jgi:uncharacterized protein
MKPSLARTPFVLAMILLVAARPTSGQAVPVSPPNPAVGVWAGFLAPIPGIELPLVFRIVWEEGVLQATMDSPDQGAFGIPVAEASLVEASLLLSLPGIGGRYTGRLTAPDTIEGQWEQGGQAFPLNLTRQTDGVPTRARSQEPVPPFPYEVRDVRFFNPDDGIHLAGTLTLPPGEGPFPAVALITGSGPQDRDETILGHRPFWILADFLTRAGIVVLRYDDRGVGESEGDFAAATSLDFAVDAGAAVAFLKAQPGIDPERVGLIGHSEGGLIAPLVAVLRGDLAFQILLAGPVLPGETILHLQGTAIQAAMGASQSVIDGNRALQERLFQIVREEEDSEARRTRSRIALEEWIEETPQELRDEMGIPSAPATLWIQGQVQSIGSPWFRFFLLHDPGPVLLEARLPTLALFGGLDLQVPAEENVAALDALFERADREHITVQVFPRLNHLFQTAQTGTPAEYGQIEETFAPEALEAIATWILERFR